MPRRKTTEEFIEQAKKVHGDKYDYSKVVYTRTRDKVKIICPTHGEFLQCPEDHLYGNGCQKCGSERIHTIKGSKEEFVQKAKIVHDNKYTYSNLVYNGLTKKGIITCPIHGDFSQILSIHLNGNGCPKCNKFRKQTKEDFLNRAKSIHKNKYDYSKVEYVNSSEKVCIICPEHGEFWQTPCKHTTSKQGCPKCGGRCKSNTLEFIEKANKVHFGKYNYDKVEYKTNRTRVIINCTLHGDFEIAPHEHLIGGGCPQCNLKSQSILWTKIKAKFPGKFLLWEYSPDWLNNQRLDICDDYYKIAIEYDGIQHYQPVEYFGGKERFELQKKWDAEKEKLCKTNGFYLFRIAYNYSDNDFEELCSKIQEIIDNTGQITEDENE